MVGKQHPYGPRKAPLLPKSPERPYCLTSSSQKGCWRASCGRTEAVLQGQKHCFGVLERVPTRQTSFCLNGRSPFFHPLPTDAELQLKGRAITNHAVDTRVSRPVRVLPSCPLVPCGGGSSSLPICCATWRPSA